MSHTFRERRGAHRPRSAGPTSAIPWLLAAVAIVAVVVYATGWFGGGGGDDGTSAKITPQTNQTKTTGQTQPSSGGSATGTNTATTPPATTSTPTATADRQQPVTVLNATRRSGLAAGAAAKLRTAGWTIRSTGNYSGGGDTTVFYGRASLRATAEAIAKDLGSGGVRESADFGASRVTVVLGADYQP